MFRETLRLRAPTHGMARQVTQDSILTGRRFAPGIPPPGEHTASGSEYDEEKTEKFNVYTPKGSYIILDVQALHMNRASMRLLLLP